VTDEILKKLEQRASRRSFLKGSALGAAAVVGVAAFPALSFAQNSQPSSDKDGQKDDQKNTEQASDQNAAKDADKKDPNAPTEDEFKITRKDENGRDYRTCPQCGYNMYRQERTWTCENCGFSYTE
jgi:secreted PhoX family phosphatase